MSGEVSTISIGVDARETSATVTPPVTVVDAGSRVRFQLAEEIRGTAVIKVLGDCGHEIPGDPNLGVSFEATRTRTYYVIVTMNNPGKRLAAMAVIIIDP
jgi:hypothetical protein